MSFEDGWAAIHMEMPKRVPRTEYSAEVHWDLIEKVTKLPVDRSNLWDDVDEMTQKAQRAFYKKWDYSFKWGIDIGSWPMHDGYMPLNGRRTSMGHADYAASGNDRRDDAHCPFTEPEDVFNFDPSQEYGWPTTQAMIDCFETRYQHRCKMMPDGVNVGGIYITMMSGLIEIFGWDLLLLSAGDDLERFSAMTKRYEKWITPFYEAFAQTNIPILMSHDDIVWTSGPILHPDWYRECIFPAYKRLWKPSLDAGKRVLYTSDGNYTMFFDDVVEAGAHGVVMEPCSDMALFAEKYGKTHVFIGNADTRVLLSGTKEAIYNEVKRCMDIGKKYPGFILAVGNHLPPNTPIENALYYDQVYRELRER